jgi:hypothetical protein
MVIVGFCVTWEFTQNHTTMKHSTLLSTHKTNWILTLLIFFSLSAAWTQPLEGEYTINSGETTAGSNFASFNDFAAALSAEGIGGDVMAIVIPGSGPYTEQVIFADVDGSGPDATIQIIGNGETLTATTDTDNRHLLRLSHMSYVHIDNLHLVRDQESTSGFYGIHVFGSGAHITITNCSADMTGTNSTLVGGYIVSGSETSILSAGDFHDIHIMNNTSDGGGYGASVYGELGNLSTNIFIDGNSFESFSSNGVYLRETDGAVVSNNYFDRSSGAVSSCNAIQLAQNANINASVFNNIIEHTQTSNGTMTYRGIYVFNGTGHNVYNNVIQNIQLESGNVTGIEVRTGGIAPNISFNTIRIDHSESTAGNLYGIKEELSNTNSVLRNNIVSIQQTTSGNAAALVLGATSTVTSALNSDYNDLYVPDGNTAMRGTFSPTFYPTLMNWQNVSQQDANSFSINPEFTAADWSVPTNSDMSDLGITLPGIDVDIEGTLRSDPPDVGAYEFEDCELPGDIEAISGPLTVCAGDDGIFYSVEMQDDADYFEWEVSADAEFDYGFVSSGITVYFGDSSTVISVTPFNDCGAGNTFSIFVEVNPLPHVELIFDTVPVCLNQPSVLLSGGSPEGGEYSGPGVSGNIFIPVEAGLGFHEIFYTYTDSSGCSQTVSNLLEVENCLSLGDKHEQYGLSVFPNPFYNILQLELPGSHSGPADVRIFDVTGKVVWQQTVQLLPNEQQLTLSVDNLGTGSYIISLSNAEVHLTQTIVKL